MDLRYELVDGLAHAREVGRERAVDDDAAGAVLGDGHVARVAVAVIAMRGTPGNSSGSEPRVR